MTQNQNPHNEQPQQEHITIAQAKRLCCEKLTKIFTSPMMNERLMKMAGGDASRVAKNLTAFLTLITQHDGGSSDPSKKKYYHQCSVSSLTTCFLESMNMQLPFDSRQLVSMIIYDWEAELDISYKGFVHALNRYYQDAFVDTKIIMDGDDFTCEEEPEKVTYKHKAKNPFAHVNSKMEGVLGCYCYFAYTLSDGRRVQRIVHVPKADLLLMRSKAKSKNVWDEWTSQQIIKSTIRRASKIPFAAIDLDIDIEEVDNRHFKLEAPGGDTRLKLLMQAQEEVVHGKPEPVADAAIDENSSTEQDKKEPEEKASVSNAPTESNDEKTDEKESDPSALPDQKQGDSANKVSPIPPAGNEHPTENTGKDKGSIHADGGTAGKIIDATYEETKPAEPNLWDGKTVYVGDGKTAVKEFASAQAAAIYLKRVVSQRKHKESRQEIIKGNKMLIFVLLKDGNQAVVDELNALAEGGA